MNKILLVTKKNLIMMLINSALIGGILTLIACYGICEYKQNQAQKEITEQIMKMYAEQ